MNYFDVNNEALKPYREYKSYVLYCIDTQNKTTGIDFFFDYTDEQIPYYEKVINDALKAAFEEYRLNKVYVNVIRDNYKLYNVLEKLNFITEAIHREQYYDGNRHDVVYMTVLRGEWERGGIRYNFKYVVQKTCEGEANSFGIQVISQSCGCSTVVEIIHDVCSDEKKIAQLVDMCNTLRLDYVHLYDVIDDFLSDI